MSYLQLRTNTSRKCYIFYHQNWFWNNGFPNRRFALWNADFTENIRKEKDSPDSSFSKDMKVPMVYQYWRLLKYWQLLIWRRSQTTTKSKAVSKWRQVCWPSTILNCSRLVNRTKKLSGEKAAVRVRSKRNQQVNCKYRLSNGFTRTWFDSTIVCVILRAMAGQRSLYRKHAVTSWNRNILEVKTY